jgi:hypothetical protein
MPLLSQFSGFLPNGGDLARAFSNLEGELRQQRDSIEQNQAQSQSIAQQQLAATQRVATATERLAGASSVFGYSSLPATTRTVRQVSGDRSYNPNAAF